MALANERSAFAGPTSAAATASEVNHQFSKSARAEALLRAATAEATGAGSTSFSILRPAFRAPASRAASPRLDPSITRAFTSCNRVFPAGPPNCAFESWCADCDKCRFVFLVLAPFMEPAALEAIFGKAMCSTTPSPVRRASRRCSTATGGHKPFECVGEEEESAAAVTLLAQDPRWRDREVVRRLIEHVPATSPDAAFALSDEHAVPDELIDDVHALLGA